MSVLTRLLLHHCLLSRLLLQLLSRGSWFLHPPGYGIFSLHVVAVLVRIEFTLNGSLYVKSLFLLGNMAYTVRHTRVDSAAPLQIEIGSSQEGRGWPCLFCQCQMEEM